MPEKTMNVLSLFSGIQVGGLELGLERAGMTVVGQVELDEFCRSVLAKHWPEVPKHDDVRTAVDWWRGEPRPPVHVVAGGFPCQDISNAHTNGTRRALAGAKSGLWSDFRDVIAELQPRWVIAENVAAWQRWLPGVRGDLHDLGYASVPVQLSADSVGAPHKRPRVFVVAHPYGESQPLRAIHAAVAGLRPFPRGGGHWGDATPGSLRVADGVPDRMDRVGALGNSVVPQVAEVIGGLMISADRRAVAA